MAATRQGFSTVTPYLQVRGAAGLLHFITRVFGAETTATTDRADGTIRHAEARIGGCMIEAADATDTFPALRAGVHVYVPDADAAFQAALHSGATTIYAPVDRVYGDRESGVRDAFGNHWYISTHKAAGAGAHIKPGLQTVTPYLHPHGAFQMIEFLQRVFDAEIENREVTTDGRIRHAQIRIGDSSVEMGEARAKWPPMAAGLHVYVDDTDAVYSRAVASGAASVMTPADQPYGDRSAAVRDACGNFWYLATRIATSASF